MPTLPLLLHIRRCNNICIATRPNPKSVRACVPTVSDEKAWRAEGGRMVQERENKEEGRERVCEGGKQRKKEF